MNFDNILKDWNVIYTSEIENLEKIKQLEEFIGNMLKQYVFDKQLPIQEELKIIDFLSELNDKIEELIINNIDEESSYNLHKKFQSSCIIKN